MRGGAIGGAARRLRALAIGGAVALAAAVASAPLLASPVHAEPGADLPVFTQVEMGSIHAAALTSTGEVYMWGYNDEGQLGVGNYALVAERPQKLDVPGDVRFVQVSAGDRFTLGLSDDGHVWGWGSNSYSELRGFGGSRTTPVDLQVSDYLETGEQVAAIAAGSQHALVLTDAGRVYAWGDNHYGQVTGVAQINTQISVPTEVTGVYDDLTDGTGKATMIAASQQSSYAARPDQRAVSWGYEYDGRLGNTGSSATSKYDHMVFSDVTSDADIVDLAAGGAGGLFLLADGTVLTWGGNASGELGLNDDEILRLSLPVELPRALFLSLGAEETVIAVQADGTQRYAVTSEGRVYAWGNHFRGRLGLGAAGSGDVLRPTPISSWPSILGDSPIVAVSGGGWGTGAVSQTGGVYTWGDGSVLGIGDRYASSYVPLNVQIGDLPLGEVTLPQTVPILQNITPAFDGWAPQVRFPYSPDWYYGGAYAVSSDSIYLLQTAIGSTLQVCSTGYAENWVTDDENPVCSHVAEIGYPQATIITATMPDATAGEPYSYELEFEAYDAQGFAVIDGALPAGITLNETTGEISGAATVAGTYTFTVELTDAYDTDETELTLSVLPADAAALGIDVSATSVPQGGSITFEVWATDEFSNLIGDVTDDVAVESDVETDVVVGNTVTFPTASPHTLTFTLEQLTDSVVIEVIPAATGGEGETADTGFDGWSIAVGAGVLLALGAATLGVARTRRLA